MCYLVAGVAPTPLDAGPAARMLLLGVNHTTTAGQRHMRHLLPLMRSEVYEWAKGLAGERQALVGSYGLSSVLGFGPCAQARRLEEQGA